MSIVTCSLKQAQPNRLEDDLVGAFFETLRMDHSYCRMTSKCFDH